MGKKSKGAKKNCASEAAMNPEARLAETLPEASVDRVFDVDQASLTLPQCHGCGKGYPADKLKKCTRCKRVYYCSKTCQALDWKAPRFHKRSCQPGLLEYAMNNLPQLSMLEKIQLGMDNVPNNNINQTINKVLSVSVAELLDVAENELRQIGELSLMHPDKLSSKSGHNRLEHVSYRFGLDDGIETLCLALNLWPGVATVNSCSGLHTSAWQRERMLHQGAVVLNPNGNLLSIDSFVSYVCDDPETLTKINNIIATGALGIQFDCVLRDGHHDKAGSLEGFATIDYLSEGKSKMCRSMCRQIALPMQKPFDRIDASLRQISDMLKEKDPFKPHQYAIVGCVVLGLKLVMEAPNLKLTPQEVQKIDQLMLIARRLRNLHIEHFGPFKDEMYEIGRKQEADISRQRSG